MHALWTTIRLGRAAVEPNPGSTFDIGHERTEGDAREHVSAYSRSEWWKQFQLAARYIAASLAFMEVACAWDLQFPTTLVASLVGPQSPGLPHQLQRAWHARRGDNTAAEGGQRWIHKRRLAFAARRGRTAGATHTQHTLRAARS